MAMALERLIELERCGVGRGTFVACGDRELAVFRLSEAAGVYVIDNSCPHASGNLSAGELSGWVVTCPWHKWRFDLVRGRCVDSEAVRVTRYPVEIRDGQVYVDFDAPY